MKTKKQTASIPKIDIPDRPFRWAGFLAAMIALLLYANTWFHDYTLDDSGVITNHAFVRKGMSGIPDILKVDLWHFNNVQLGYYRPLSLITFAIEIQFFGMNPHISHIVNTLLFAFTVYILFIFLRELFRKQRPAFAFLAVCLFAAHPIHTEVVANIKSRDEILSFLNLFLALLFFLRFSRNGKKLLLIPGIIFFYFAMLSKETSLIGVALGPAIVWYAGEKKLKEMLWVSGAMVFVAAVFFIQKKMLLGNISGVIPDDPVNYPYKDIKDPFPTVFLFVGMMGSLLLFPLWLKYDYSFNAVPAADWSAPLAFLGLVIAALAAGYILYRLKEKNPLRLSAFAFFVCAAPSLAFVYLRGGIFVERLLYAPSLWFCIALVFILGKIFKEDFKKPDKTIFLFLKKSSRVSGLVLLFFVFFAGKTVLRNPAWKNNFTLFSTDILNNPNSTQNHRHLGSEYINKAMEEKDSLKKKEFFTFGVEELKRSIAIYPKMGDALSKLGVAYQSVYFNADSAEKYYKRAIEASPGLAMPYNNLGILYGRIGKQELSSYYLNKSFEVNPQFEEGRKNAAALKKATGLDVHLMPININADSLQKSETIKDDTLYYNLGTIFASKGEYEKAIAQFKIAAEMNPKYEDAFINMGNCYGVQGRYQESVDCNLRVIKVNPKNQRALLNLSISYDKLGMKAKADEAREQLAKLERK